MDRRHGERGIQFETFADTQPKESSFAVAWETAGSLTF
jgi:hypothetical protein